MPRVVLDANVFVSAFIRPDGPPGQLLRLCIEEQAFELVVSDSILEELRRSLAYPRVQKYISASNHELEAWVAAIGLIATPVAGVVRHAVIAADPDDDKYIAAALDGRAKFVVSGDRHLLDLKEYEDIRVVPPRAFLDLLKTIRGKD